jgi:hypothetical protein
MIIIFLNKSNNFFTFNKSNYLRILVILYDQEHQFVYFNILNFFLKKGKHIHNVGMIMHK